MTPESKGIRYNTHQVSFSAALRIKRCFSTEQRPVTVEEVEKLSPYERLELACLCVAEGHQHVSAPQERD